MMVVRNEKATIWKIPSVIIRFQNVALWIEDAEKTGGRNWKEDIYPAANFLNIEICTDWGVVAFEAQWSEWGKADFNGP